MEPGRIRPRVRGTPCRLDRARVAGRTRHAHSRGAGRVRPCTMSSRSPSTRSPRSSTAAHRRPANSQAAPGRACNSGTRPRKQTAPPSRTRRCLPRRRPKRRLRRAADRPRPRCRPPRRRARRQAGRSRRDPRRRTRRRLLTICPRRQTRTARRRGGGGLDAWRPTPSRLGLHHQRTLDHRDRPHRRPGAAPSYQPRHPRRPMKLHRRGAATNNQGFIAVSSRPTEPTEASARSLQRRAG
jgi:hypothetical protein